jgi:hypothetical protein
MIHELGEGDQLVGADEIFETWLKLLLQKIDETCQTLGIALDGKAPPPTSTPPPTTRAATLSPVCCF